MPVEIRSEEILIRAVTTYHLNPKGKPRPVLFSHRTDKVSVSRRQWLAPWLAKLYAKARIQNKKLQRPCLYVGLAFVSAECVRKHGASVVDTREEYLGHADISTGIVQSPQEALPPHLMKARDDITKAITKTALFIKDPKPNNFFWYGDKYGAVSRAGE